MPDPADRYETALAPLRREGGANPLADPRCAILLWQVEPPRLLWGSPNAHAVAIRLADGEGRPTGEAERTLGLAAGFSRLSPDTYRLERVRLGANRLAAPTLMARRIVEIDGQAAILTAFPGEGRPEAAPPPARTELETSGAGEGVEARAELEPEVPPLIVVPADEKPDTPSSDNTVPDRHGRRFVFRTDEAGRFTFLSRDLEEVVGPRGADILGRPWQDLAGHLVLDSTGDIANAFRAGSSWTRHDVLWCGRSSDTAVPGELSGTPIRRPDGHLDGFRGFGILFPDEARQVRPGTFRSPVAAADRADPHSALNGPLGQALEAAAALTGSAGETMLDVLKAFFTQAGDRYGAAANVAAPRDPARRDDARSPPAAPPGGEDRAALTSQEHGAFEEIARALGREREKTPGFDPATHADPAREGATPEVQPVRTGTEEAGRLLDALPIGIAVLRDGAPVFANRALLDLTGADDLPALVAMGGLAAAFPGLLDRAEAASGEPVEGESAEASAPGRVVLRMEQTVWGDLPASLLSAMPAVDRGPAERVAALEQEAMSRERTTRELTRSLALSADLALIVDGAGRISAVGPRSAKPFADLARDLVGLPLASLIQVEDHLASLAGLDEARAAGHDGAVSREVRIALRNGRTLPALMRIGLLSEVPPSYAVVLRDLSPAKAMEAELGEAQARLRQAGIDQSDFLGRVSHDIRTPLTAINGFAELMLDERFSESPGERVRGYIEDIRESGRQVIGLVGDLFDLAKADAGRAALDRVALDLNEVAQAGVVGSGHAATEERTIIRTSFAPGLPQIRGDRDSVLRAVLNVMANAIRLAGAGGQIIVSTTAGRVGEAVLSVRNTGPGLSPEEIEAAMTPFRAAPATLRGTPGGVGLPLSRALIQANGGRFAITSEPARGMLVEMRFPGIVPARGVIAAE